jgi:hypothetical protein
MCCFLFQGCALVHLKLFERIVEQGDRWALILEDDFCSFVTRGLRSRRMRPLLSKVLYVFFPPYGAGPLFSKVLYTVRFT